MTYRVRRIRPGENVVSLDEEIHSENTRFVFLSTRTGKEESPKMLFYNEADMLEDQVLFPEELTEDPSKAMYRELRGGMSKLEMEGFDFGKFVHDVDSDLDEFDHELEEYEDTFIDDHAHEDDDDSDEEDDDHYAPEDSKSELAEDSPRESQLVELMASLGMTNTTDGLQKQTGALSGCKEPMEGTALDRYGPSKEVQTYLDNWVLSESSYYDDPPVHEHFLDFIDREKATGKRPTRCQMVLT